MRARLLSLAALIAVGLQGTAAHATEFPGINPAPAGFTTIATALADGEYDPASANPNVPGCFFGFCDGNYFHTQIAERTPDEVAQLEQDAKAFFSQRFGVDVDALAGSGAITFLDAYIDPRANYRVRSLSSEHVHELGWELHDWVLVVISNQDIPLAGEWEGSVMPAGSMLGYGEYWIQKSRLDRRGDAPVLVDLDQYLVVRYRSSSPFVIDSSTGYGAGGCEVFDSPWGAGLVQVLSGPAGGSDGTIRGNTRNVMTFDGGDGLGTHPGVYN
ncbi:MAG: hypothetical protein AAGA68_10545 [Pseudomonadota bacterium]